MGKTSKGGALIIVQLLLGENFSWLEALSREGFCIVAEGSSHARGRRTRRSLMHQRGRTKVEKSLSWGRFYLWFFNRTFNVCCARGLEITQRNAHQWCAADAAWRQRWTRHRRSVLWYNFLYIFYCLTYHTVLSLLSFLPYHESNHQSLKTTVLYSVPLSNPEITYYWTGLLILDHLYLVGNLTNSKIAETKALEPLKSRHFCISNFRTCLFTNQIWVVQD
jgi:hypothetical protein